MNNRTSKGNTLSPVVSTENNEFTEDGSLNILGSKAIDNVLIALQPELKDTSSQNIQIISKLIKGYIFEEESTIEIIGKICNKDIIIYIQGLRQIAIEHNITNIEGIDKYFENPQEIINIDDIIIDAIGY